MKIKPDSPRLSMDEQAKTMIVVEKALNAQFSNYSWENMINDCFMLSETQKKWAKKYLGYKLERYIF